MAIMNSGIDNGPGSAVVIFHIQVFGNDPSEWAIKAVMDGLPALSAGL